MNSCSVYLTPAKVHLNSKPTNHGDCVFFFSFSFLCFMNDTIWLNQDHDSTHFISFYVIIIVTHAFNEQYLLAKLKIGLIAFKNSRKPAKVMILLQC